MLAEHGHDVGVHYRGDPDGAAAAVADVTASGCRAVALHADLAVDDATALDAVCDRLLDECAAAVGAPDVVVLNAFPQDHLEWDALDTAAWDAFHRAGLRPTTALLHRAAARLGEGGVIVVVGSIEGLRPTPTHTPYAVAKAALHHLTAAAAAELGARGIRVVAVAPGLVDRDGLAAGLARGGRALPPGVGAGPAGDGSRGRRDGGVPRLTSRFRHHRHHRHHRRRVVVDARLVRSASSGACFPSPPPSSEVTTRQRHSGGRSCGAAQAIASACLTRSPRRTFMKSTRYLVVVPAALALALAGCGGSTGSSDTPAATGSTAAGAPADDSNCASPDVYCIGLVTDTGKVDDKSFNQSAHEGALAAAEQTKGFYKYIETQDAKDYAANMAQFTNKKYDTIVTVGFLMTDATTAAAKANPTTRFIGVDQGYDATKVTEKNITGLIFPEDQAGYGAGYLAGLMTKTNKLGQVLGLEIPPVQKFAKGFEAGAKAANPKVTVATVYHPAADNAFNDPVWGAGEAKKQLAQGADIIFGAGGNTGNGALQEVAKTTGAGTDKFCIGVDTDQWDTVPAAQPCLVTSAMKLISDGVTETAVKAKDGDFTELQTLGKAGLAPFHDFESVVPAEVKAKVDEVVKQMEAGTLQTGVTL